MTSPRDARAGDLLVVDDNRVNRLLLGRALEQLGHRVSFAENGRQAIEALRQREVDLVLLDIEMPEMDGYQTLTALGADPRLRDIPVVMMSSLEEVDSVARCIELGAEDYLFKPVNAVLLKARVGASLVWIEDEVDAWIAARFAERKQPSVPHEAPASRARAATRLKAL